jgi:hypothetical protein
VALALAAEAFVASFGLAHALARPSNPKPSQCTFLNGQGRAAGRMPGRLAYCAAVSAPQRPALINLA